MATLPKELSDAYKAVNKHIDDALAEGDSIKSERERMEQMTKEGLIEELMLLKFSPKQTVHVMNMVYSILEDPICAFLTYDMVAAAIEAREIPGVKTKTGSVRWYASKAIEFERDVVPRVHHSVINRLIAKIKA
jgi:hypothetical protein